MHRTQLKSNSRHKILKHFWEQKIRGLEHISSGLQTSYKGGWRLFPGVCVVYEAPLGPPAGKTFRTAINLHHIYSKDLTLCRPWEKEYPWVNQ